MGEEGISGFLWGAHRKEQALPTTCCGCFKTSGCFHPRCGCLQQRQKNTPVFFKPLGASLSPFKCSCHPTHIICMSLCKSPSLQNTITPNPKQHREGKFQELLKPVRNSPVRGRKKQKDEEKGTAVSYGELWQRGEMGLRWSNPAVEGPAEGRLMGQAVGEAKPWWSVREGTSLEPLQWKMSPQSFCRTQVLEQSPQQHRSFFGGSNTHLHAARLRSSRTSNLSLRPDGLSVTAVKFCSLRALCRRLFNHYPNITSFLGKCPVICKCLSWGPVQSSPRIFGIPGPYPTVSIHRAQATAPMMNKPRGFAQKKALEKHRCRTGVSYAM